MYDTEEVYYDTEDDGLMDTLPVEDLDTVEEEPLVKVKPVRHDGKARLPKDDGADFPENLAAAIGLGDDEEDLLKIEPVSTITMLAVMEVARLSEREVKVLMFRYRDRLELYGTGKQFGVTRERIRQIEAKALRKMRGRKACREILQKGFYQWTQEQIRQRADAIVEERIKQFKTQWLIDHPEPEYVAGDPVDPEINERASKMQMTIEELDLSVRSYNCLKRANINTVGDLVKRSYDNMMCVRNLGRKSLEEIIAKLASLGLKLAEEDLSGKPVKSTGEDMWKIGTRLCPGCGSPVEYDIINRFKHCHNCGTTLERE